MKTFTYKITDEVGIHARPAGMLVNEAKQCQAKITIKANGKSAEAARLMAVMGLGVKKGTEVEVTVEAEDEAKEAESAERIKKFFEEHL